MANIKTPNELTEIASLAGTELFDIWDADEAAVNQ